MLGSYSVSSVMIPMAMSSRTNRGGGGATVQYRPLLYLSPHNGHTNAHTHTIHSDESNSVYTTGIAQPHGHMANISSGQ